MNILLTNLVFVYIMSFFSRINPKDRILEVDYRNYNKIFIIMALISLICVSGFRYKSGTDFTNYTENFIYFNEESVKESGSIGFDLLVVFLRNISSDPQIMFLCTSIIINVLIVIILQKYSIKFELSMWLYITTFTYYSTFNGIRQWIAAAIVFLGIRYLIIDRKFIQYSIVVLIASAFHSSVLIMIPIYFIIDTKTISKRNLYIICGFMAAVFAYSKFIPILFTLLEGTQYAYYFDIMQDTSNGVNPLRVIVYFAPIFLYLLFNKDLNPNNDIRIDRLVNLCVLGCLTMFLALKQVFFARLIYYFDLYYLLLIPMVINVTNKEYKRFLTYCVMIGYFAYSYMLLVAQDAWIIPYTFKITLF